MFCTMYVCLCFCKGSFRKNFNFSQILYDFTCMMIKFFWSTIHLTNNVIYRFVLYLKRWEWHGISPNCVEIIFIKIFFCFSHFKNIKKVTASKFTVMYIVAFCLLEEKHNNKGNYCLSTLYWYNLHSEFCSNQSQLSRTFRINFHWKWNKKLFGSFSLLYSYFIHSEFLNVKRNNITLNLIIFFHSIIK